MASWYRRSPLRTSTRRHLSTHAIVELAHRRVLAVRGADAVKFLQAYCTNDVALLLRAPPPAGGTRAQFTAFLNAKGRTVAEATVSLAPPPPGGAAAPPTLLLDVDAASAPALLGALRGYVLRSRVEVVDLSASHAVTALLPTDPFALAAAADCALSLTPPPGTHASPSPRGLLAHAARGAAHTLDAPSAAYYDPRGAASALGIRAISPRGVCPFESLAPPHATLPEYHALRMLLGIPEGAEVVGEVPLEWNLTLLRGVSFSKGCYLGQELVARTHFRGLVRKRFVPVYLTGAGAPPRPPAAADAIAAACVRQTVAAITKHVGSSKAGGWGHGMGHGPSETHALHESPAQVDRHSVAGAMHHHHSRIAVGASSPSASSSSSTTGARIRLPFPFLDRAWRGGESSGAAVGDVLASHTPTHGAGRESAAGHGSEPVGARAGRLVALAPAANLGLALLRLSFVAHTLPHAPHGTRDTAPDGSAPNEGNPHRETASLLPWLDVDEGRGGGVWVGDDAATEGIATALTALHARAGAASVDLVLHAQKGGDGGAEERGRALHRVIPILPPWWRHIAHPGVD